MLAMPQVMNCQEANRISLELGIANQKVRQAACVHDWEIIGNGARRHCRLCLKLEQLENPMGGKVTSGPPAGRWKYIGQCPACHAVHDDMGAERVAVDASTTDFETPAVDQNIFGWEIRCPKTGERHYLSALAEKDVVPVEPAKLPGFPDEIAVSTPLMEWKGRSYASADNDRTQAARIRAAVDILRCSVDEELEPLAREFLKRELGGKADA